MRLLLLAGLVSCGYPEVFTEPQTLGGVVVDAHTLNEGAAAYAYYCVSCHGVDGDGRGPSAREMITPARDFRIATYKFAGVPEGYLPSDEDLGRIVRAGLRGTAMLEWEMPDHTLHAVLQYIKTFSPPGEGWRDPDNEVGEPIVPGEDPYAGQDVAATVERGRALFHGMADCHSCHPAYETREEINGHLAQFDKPARADYRKRFWLSEAKPSDSYTIPVAGDPVCEDVDQCGSDDEFVCRYGRCERKQPILPPDFTVNDLRNGTTVPELYRTIASGVPGTAMPMWAETMDSKDIWALAYYVNSLVELQHTHEAVVLKSRLRADTKPLILPSDETEGGEATEAPPEG